MTTMLCLPAKLISSFPRLDSLPSSVIPAARLIDQEELGILGQQHADLEPLLLTMSQPNPARV